MPDQITLTAPDDWHIHLRDDSALKTTVDHASRAFQRAIVMPNLVPPVLSAEQAMAYKARINSAIPTGETFTPLMVLYLTDNTTPAMVEEAKKAGVVAFKLYPAGATTNSDSGVTSMGKIAPALSAMQANELKLLVHGEVTDSTIDIFDREAVFIETKLKPIVQNFPKLNIVLEHITTKDAVDFVGESPDNIAATITAHHLLFNRNHMLVGGIKPHYYCLPILKRNIHQQALIKAATSGNKKFFLGTDSAPHAKSAKESACGCAGSYTAYSPMALYAMAFDGANSLDKLEGFSSFYGPDFYGLERNNEKITLVKRTWKMPDSLDFNNAQLIPLMAGEEITWQQLSDA